MVQLSHLYMSNGKTVALAIWTFVGKMMSLFFNMLSRFIIAFLSKSKSLLISWRQLPSAVILEHKKIKYVTASTFFPTICHKVKGLDGMILVFWMSHFILLFHSHQEALPYAWYFFSLYLSYNCLCISATFDITGILLFLESSLPWWVILPSSCYCPILVFVFSVLLAWLLFYHFPRVFTDANTQFWLSMILPLNCLP